METHRNIPVRRPIRALFALAPVAALSTGAGVLSAVTRVPENRIAPGVQVASLALGGKSVEEARAALNALAKQNEIVQVVLRFPEEYGIQRTWNPPAARLGLGLDIDRTLDEARQAGRSSLLMQLVSRVNGARKVDVAPRPTVDETRLRAYLKQQVARDVHRAPENARLVVYAKGGFGIKKEKPGFALDIETSAQAVKQAWMDYYGAPASPADNAPKEGEAAPPNPPLTPLGTQEGTKAQETPPAARTKETLDVNLTGTLMQPKLTADALKDINGDLSNYTTYYGGTGRNRGNNIALAAGRINGTLLAPGDIFSYNKIVGPRVASAGFKEAPVIIKGELVPGIGGGICQVSTTLYNAVLLADLKITRRSHHAFPVHYVPAGRDATVVDGSIDFQFQNSTAAPIYIAASASKGRLSFRILGKKMPGKSVKIELSNHQIIPNGSKTLKDPSLPAGKRIVKESGHRGHRVKVYRVVRENGQVTKRELIANDYYRPFPSVIIVGAGAPAVPPPTNPAVPGVPPANSAAPPTTPAPVSGNN
jgi:vancomycin resistance protein YoaR